MKLLKKRTAKELLTFLSAGLTVAISTVYCFAAEFDTTQLAAGIKNGLIAVFGVIGGGLAVMGVLKLVESHSSNDPNAQAQAIKQVAAGIGLIVVAGIVIPVFTDAIKF